MLIPLDYIIKRYHIKPTGILHIGANVGEERVMYDKLGISRQIWIEGNPDIFVTLKQNISHNPNAVALNYLIGDENKESVLHESNNGSQSSSVLDLEYHKIDHPDVHYVRDIPLQMHRIDSLGLNLDGIDFLNIDLQGAELMALKGMGDLIRGFKMVYLEVNKKELYKGCPLVGDLDLYLLGYGFKRVETKWCGNFSWGDGLWIRK